MAKKNEKTNPTIDSSMVVSGSYNFWNVLEMDAGIKIPIYMKNLLTFNGFDNPLSFRHITEVTIDELEKFSRETMKIFLEPKDNPQDYYGCYHESPENFKFRIGDRLLLSELVKFVKSEPQNFRKSVKITPTIEDNKHDLNIVKLLTANNSKPRNSFAKFTPKFQDNKHNSKCQKPRKANKANSSNSSDISIPPIIEEQRKKISKIVKKYLQEVKAQNNGEKQQMIPTENVHIIITKAKVKKNENVPLSQMYDAKIKCALCTRYPKVNVCKRSGGQPSWGISNYKQHIKRHIKVCEEDSSDDSDVIVVQ